MSTCRHKYIGETSRSTGTRGKEHLRALEQREQNSLIWRHSCAKHGGNVPGFTMNVTGPFRNYAMLKQISESIQINQAQQDQLINTNSEWSNFRIPIVQSLNSPFFPPPIGAESGRAKRETLFSPARVQPL